MEYVDMNVIIDLPKYTAVIYSSLSLIPVIYIVYLLVFWTIPRSSIDV